MSIHGWVWVQMWPRLFSMRPLPSMFNWSCPHLTFAISCQGSEPFSSDLYPDLKLNLFFNLHQKYKFLPLVLGFFFWCNYGRFFWSFHQNYFLCICKRSVLPKVLFFQISQICSLPRFSGPGYVSAAQNRCGELLVTEQWPSWAEAVLDARALHRYHSTNQPTIPPTNESTNQAHWCCCSSMD